MVRGHPVGRRGRFRREVLQMIYVWRYALTVAAACGLSYFGIVAIIR